MTTFLMGAVISRRQRVRGAYMGAVSLRRDLYVPLSLWAAFRSELLQNTPAGLYSFRKST